MTAWYVALLALIVIAVGTFVVVRLRADLTGAVDSSLAPASDQIANDYAKEGIPEFADSAGTVLTGERRTAQLLASDGTLITSFGDPVSRARMIARADVAQALSGRRVLTSESLRGADFRLTARRVIRKGDVQVVVAGQSLRPVQDSVRRTVTALLLAGPAALLATALGGWWLARRALRPVEGMTATAAAIGPERLGDRVDVPATRDEVAYLGRTLNTMLDRVQRGVEEQQRLVADASHELRTPLAAMRAELDVSLRGELEPESRRVLLSVREEVDRMSRTRGSCCTASPSTCARSPARWWPGWRRWRTRAASRSSSRASRSSCTGMLSGCGTPSATSSTTRSASARPAPWSRSASSGPATAHGRSWRTRAPASRPSSASASSTGSTAPTRRAPGPRAGAGWASRSRARSCWRTAAPHARARARAARA
jgi:hypothetical protein